MNDEVKAAIDELGRRALPVDEAVRARELILWVRGEPERLARAREEQREVCALEAKEYCCGQEPERVVRLTPLATTPLADENAALRQQRDDAWADLWAAHERLDEFGMRRDGSKATVVEGIAAMRDRIGELRAWAHASETEASGAEARVKELRDALKTEVESLARDMVTMTRTANAEVEAGLALKTQLDEAVAALRRAAQWCHSGHGCFPAKQCGLCSPVLAVLAKHPEGK